MGHASTRAAEGLERAIAADYAISPADAYRDTGISSMNGHTDEASETVTVGDFETMLAFASQHELARFTFWSVNRDRPCAGADTSSDSCSGIAQAPYAFTDMIAGFA